ELINRARVLQSQQEAGNKQDNAALKLEVLNMIRDQEASAQQNPNTATPLPSDEMMTAAGLTEFDILRTKHDAQLNAMIGASNQEIRNASIVEGAAIVDALKPEGEGFADEELIHRAVSTLYQIEKDFRLGAPAEFAMERNQIITGEFEQAFVDDPSITPAISLAGRRVLKEQYYASTRQFQADMGIPDENQRLLTQAHAQKLVADIQGAETQIERFRMIRDLDDDLGSGFPQIVEQLTENGMDQRIVPMTQIASINEVGGNKLGVALDMERAGILSDKLPSGQKAAIDLEVDSAFDSYMLSFGDNNSDLKAAFLSDGQILGYYFVKEEGMSESRAAAESLNILLGNHEILEAGAGFLRVPTDTGIDIKLVKRASFAIDSFVSLVFDEIADEDVPFDPDIPVIEDRRKLLRDNLAHSAALLTNRDESGLFLTGQFGTPLLEFTWEQVEVIAEKLARVAFEAQTTKLRPRTPFDPLTFNPQTTKLR
ncbi:hypothetical protein LCGC14_1898570, partial [marine sediment metagenome]